MTRSEIKLKGMMKRFKRYIDKKGLTLSAGKSKVVVWFGERKRTHKEKRMKMGKKEIEEIKEMSYLGYIIQKNDGAEKHIAERMRRTMVAIKQTWSIGERIFADGYERRIKMFNVSGKHGSIRGSEDGETKKGWRK